MLLECGTDLDGQHGNGVTALAMAAREGQARVVKLLIDWEQTSQCKTTSKTYHADYPFRLQFSACIHQNRLSSKQIRHSWRGE